MTRHPIIAFYLLAFAISWLGWIPAALGSRGVEPFDNAAFQSLLIFSAIGPALAAAIVTRVTQGATAVRDLFRALLHWRVGPVWYLVAVLGPVLLLLLAQGMTRGLGLAAAQPEPPADLLPLAISALVMSLLSNPWEEVGWRGFALPHLQKQHTALVATLIVGVLWALWHLPLFFWQDNPMSNYPFAPWFAGTVAGAFIYTWLYNSTRGSLLLVSLFHVAFNTGAVVLAGASVIALAALQVIVAVVLVGAFGSKDLARQERVRAG